MLRAPVRHQSIADLSARLRQRDGFFARQMTVRSRCSGSAGDSVLECADRIPIVGKKGIAPFAVHGGILPMIPPRAVSL
jgi:hypothetical protein